MVIFLCLPTCVCAYILVDELISPKDIDPIHRYVPRQDQRNVSMRYSNQVSFNVTVITWLTPELASRLIIMNTA